ncbi:zf-HC2 domain-containing protein [Allofournierella sp.]|uniref:zf-HC2 domain-containing protein n=1 Tax=Allofournierella sp. TaxID=1940256 RepID=UPI003AEF9E86
MNGIPCDVCLDLMPLVQDGVASAASEALVKQHLEHCPRCRAIFGGAGQAPPPAPNEQRMARRLRQGVHGWAAGLVLAAAVLCLALLNGGESSALIFWLLPLLGGLLFTYWNSRWKQDLLALDLALAGIGGAWGYFSAAAGWRLHRALREFCTQFLFCGLLLLLGAAIAALLRFAFARKEEK